MTIFIIFCVSLWLLSHFVIAKQNQNKNQTAPIPPIAAPAPMEIFSEETQSPLTKIKENIPKNEHVPIVESVSTEFVPKNFSSENYQKSSVEKTYQSIDNELQKNIDLQFNPDEIKKGFIYSVILKRPEY